MEECLKIETITPGDEKNFPQKGNKVSVHYVGTFPDGNKFDSSIDRKTPFVFTLGVQQVIRGWDEGVAQMSLGQKIKLTCPSQYAYGEKGFPQIIPPKSTLIFEIELLKIN